MKQGKSGLKRWLDASSNSFRGIGACWKNEAAFRQNVLLSIVLFACSFFLARSVEQWLILIFPLFLIQIVELLNTAVENIVDRIGSEWNELSGRAKDMGSAAVLFCLFLIATTWISVAWVNLS